MLFRSKEKSDDKKCKTSVTIPYIKGVSESISRVFHRYGASTSVKPHLTLRRMLVHPKDKRAPQEQAGVVYQIPCKDCSKVYTGETGRRFGMREKEHRKDVNSVVDLKFTRSRKKDSTSEYHPSALTDHVAQHNHTIDWDNVRLPLKESDWMIRGIK